MRFQSSEFDNVYIRSDCFGSENQYEMDSKDADCIAEVVEMLNEVRMSYFEKYFLSYEPGNMTPEMTIVLHHGKKDITIDCYGDVLCFEQQDFSGEEKKDRQHKLWSVDYFARRVNEIIRKYGEQTDPHKEEKHSLVLSEGWKDEVFNSNMGNKNKMNIIKVPTTLFLILQLDNV